MWGCVAEKNAHRRLWCHLKCESLVDFVQCLRWQGWSMLAGHGAAWCLCFVSDGSFGHSELWQKFEGDTACVRRAFIAVKMLIVDFRGTTPCSLVFQCVRYLPTYVPVAKLRNGVWAEVCQWRYLCSVCRYTEQRWPVVRWKVPIQLSYCRFRIIRIY